MFDFTHHIYFSNETIFKCCSFFGSTAIGKNLYGYNLITILPLVDLPVRPSPILDPTNIMLGSTSSFLSIQDAGDAASEHRAGSTESSAATLLGRGVLLNSPLPPPPLPLPLPPPLPPSLPQLIVSGRTAALSGSANLQPRDSRGINASTPRARPDDRNRGSSRGPSS